MILNKHIKDKVDKVALQYENFIEKNRIESKKNSFEKNGIRISYVLFSFVLSSLFLKSEFLFISSLVLFLPYIFLYASFQTTRSTSKIRRFFLLKSKKLTPLKMRIFNRFESFNHKQDKIYDDFISSLNEDEKHILNSFGNPYYRLTDIDKEYTMAKYLRYYLNKNSIETITENKETILYLISKLEKKHSKDYLTGILVNKLNLLDINIDKNIIVKNEKILTI
jgi:hypothetical protein